MRALRLLCLVPAVAWAGATADSQVVRPPRTRFGDRFDNVRHERFRAYASDTLRYDTTWGAGDEQRLMLIVNGRQTYGPLAKIEPEVGSHLLKDSDLAEGRVIARIRSEGPYRKLGLDTGWNWWWVDKHGSPGDTSWRSVFITSRGRRTVKGLELDPHPPGYWKQAIARFLWSDTDERAWGSCGGNCCGSN